MRLTPVYRPLNATLTKEKQSRVQVASHTAFRQLVYATCAALQRDSVATSYGVSIVCAQPSPTSLPPPFCRASPSFFFRLLHGRLQGETRSSTTVAENQSVEEIVEEAKVMNASRPWEDSPGGSIFQAERRGEGLVKEGKERDRWSLASAKSEN